MPKEEQAHAWVKIQEMHYRRVTNEGKSQCDGPLCLSIDPTESAYHITAHYYLNASTEATFKNIGSVFINQSWIK